MEVRGAGWEETGKAVCGSAEGVRAGKTEEGSDDARLQAKAPNNKVKRTSQRK